MLVFKLIGVFFLAVGVYSLIQRKKKLKAYETGKGNECLGEIQDKPKFRKWPYIILIILGCILITASNFRANISVVKNGEKEVIWEGEISDENDVTEDESVDSIEEGETKDSEIEWVEKESEEISENDITEDGQVTYTIRIGGYDLSIPLPADWDTYAYDFLISAYPTDYNISLDYTDSFINVGDVEALETEINSVEEIYNVSVTSGTFTQNEKTNYVCYWVYENMQIVQIYQDIGAETYFLVKINDYDAQYGIDELINAFCITIN